MWRYYAKALTSSPFQPGGAGGGSRGGVVMNNKAKLASAGRVSTPIARARFSFDQLAGLLICEGRVKRTSRVRRLERDGGRVDDDPCCWRFDDDDDDGTAIGEEKSKSRL